MIVREFVDCFDIELLSGTKRYLPIEDKRKLVVGVIAMCTDDIGGLVEVDQFRMNIYFEMNMLKEYFDLDVSNNFDKLMKEYDTVCESGVLYKVHSLLSYEYDALKELLDQELKELLEENSIEKQLSKLVVKLHDAIKTLDDKIKGVDINDMLLSGMDMSSVSKILNMLK